jgi:hypothetical protein
MSTGKEKIRWKKVLAAKLLIESGCCDEIEEEIDEILAGKTTMSSVFLAHFGLLTQEIQECKAEARKRASWSFYCVLVAMGVGFAIVFWGAHHILGRTTWDYVAAASAITAIGAGISAFLVKTFLGVHRLALQQFNLSCQDSLLTRQILMAKMLADGLRDPQVRQKAYGQIISHLLALS